MEARWELQQEKTRAGTGQVPSQNPEGGKGVRRGPSARRVVSPPHPLPASILGSAREGGGKGGRCSARGLLDWT